jgi:hypothetical protein
MNNKRPLAHISDVLIHQYLVLITSLSKECHYLSTERFVISSSLVACGMTNQYGLREDVSRQFYYKTRVLNFDICVTRGLYRYNTKTNPHIRKFLTYKSKSSMWAIKFDTDRDRDLMIYRTAPSIMLVSRFMPGLALLWTKLLNNSGEKFTEVMEDEAYEYGF